MHQCCTTVCNADREPISVEVLHSYDKEEEDSDDQDDSDETNGQKPTFKYSIPTRDNNTVAKQLMLMNEQELKLLFEELGSQHQAIAQHGMGTLEDVIDGLLEDNQSTDPNITTTTV